MRLDFYISKAELNKFVASCEVAVRNIDTATKAGTEQACKDILAESLRQVPRDTGALASTAFYDVTRRMATQRYTYEGVVGYAGAGGVGYARDAYNSKSRVNVSQYAVQVHEDLNASHPNGGKAKFLEDPVRDYGKGKFTRVAEEHWRYAIEQTNAGGTMIIPTKG